MSPREAHLRGEGEPGPEMLLFPPGCRIVPADLSNVPGGWLRNPKTGVAVKVIWQDTWERALKAGYIPIDDPTEGDKS